MPCKKALQMGKTEDKLDENEVIRRLEIWFLAGNDPVTASFYKWPTGAFHTCHLNYGGYRLWKLGSSVPSLFDEFTDADLDAACETYV